MPSRRMIDPAFWQSEKVAELPFDVRLLFIGLISNADDQGRMRALPALIRTKVFPIDDVSLEWIESGLQAIQAQAGVILYRANGKDLLQIRKWWTFQSPSWAWPSDYPPPDGWQDRLKYRRGNDVISENWDSPHSDPIVTPEQGQAETDATSAPSTSGSDSTRTSGNDSGSVDSLAADAPPSPLAPETIGQELLFEMLAAEYHAKNRRAPGRFKSLACKEKFAEAEKRLRPSELEAAIQRGLEKSILSVDRMTDWVAKWGTRGPPTPPPPDRNAGLQPIDETGALY